MMNVDHAKSFRALHERNEILVLPGVWDALSARVFAAEGFPAIGTTSSGMAWSMGRTSGQELPWPTFLDACQRVAQSVSIPVSFDIEAGFGTSAEEICANVRNAIEVGACGINLEDGVNEGILQPEGLTVGTIKGIRKMCNEISYPLFINARTDVYLGGMPEGSNRLAETIRRGQLFAEAGADGLFAPGILDSREIQTVVNEVPLPLNVYALPGLPSAGELQDIGVRRVSVGCGPLQSVLTRMRTIAGALKADGDWKGFTNDWVSPNEAASL